MNIFETEFAAYISAKKSGQRKNGNWFHSIQITFYHSFAIKLFSFAGLPGRKNNLPVLFFTSTLQVMYHL